MAKFSTYAAASALCASGIVIHAVSTRRQFYPVIFYLAHSKICFVLLLNMGFVIMCIIWQLIHAIFLGPLREAEVERLNEQSWRELMEILFAMTVFRDEFDFQFLFLVTLLLFIKSYHWLAEKRVEYIETTPSVQRLSHVRLCTFMALLLTLDCLFFHRSFSHLLKTRQASVSLFFAFEYAILVTSSFAVIIKYVLYMREIACEGLWTGKAVCIFYLQLVQDLLHLSLYLLFFLAIFMHYGLPLHLVRELYDTFRNFKSRITDFIRYKRLTSNMNERFPDAAPEDISRDSTCIICREEMTVAKKLPCGHLFHVHCLRSWLERQQTCPTCRAPMLVSEEETPSDEDVAPDMALYEEEENELTVDANALNEGEEMADGADVSTGPNLAAGQHSQSHVYPAFTAGGLTWYPMLVPVLPHQHPPAGEAGPSTGSNSAGPAILADLSVQQWAWMPLVSQAAESSNPLPWVGIPPLQYPPQALVSASTHGIPASIEAMGVERTASSNCASHSLLRTTVCWLPGSLSVSRRDEQLSYLKRVFEILQKQLQSTIVLQDQLIALKDDSLEVPQCRNLEHIDQQQTNNLSNFQTVDKDSKGKVPVECVKYHCEHCSLVQLTENLGNGGNG